jgi:pimeloyl-ACP methyl ester carboxylesterase
MSKFVLIHGAGNSAWYWHLVEPELRKRGHDVVAMDLPCDDDSAGLAEYADTVVNALGQRRDRLRFGRDNQPDTVGVCGGERMTPSRSAR